MLKNQPCFMLNLSEGPKTTNIWLHFFYVTKLYPLIIGNLVK